MPRPEPNRSTSARIKSHDHCTAKRRLINRHVAYWSIFKKLAVLRPSLLLVPVEAEASIGASESEAVGDDAVDLMCTRESL